MFRSEAADTRMDFRLTTETFGWHFDLGEPAPLSARNLSKIAHIQLPALPPTVQRWIDCPIRGESARKRSRCSQGRSLFRKKGRCSFTGAANGAVVLDHALPTPDSPPKRSRSCSAELTMLHPFVSDYSKSRSSRSYEPLGPRPYTLAATA
jgi:hypothetical protein